MSVERRDLIKVNLSPRNSFDLTMALDDRKFGLAVVEPANFGHDTPEAVQDLLRTVMVAHLVAPYFPKIIETNFGLSVYRLVRFLERGEAVLAVHLRNLNAKGNYAEASASQRQCEVWGLSYNQVRLKNSSGNYGFDTMRTRDLLLALLVAVNAKPHGVRRVVIEGGMSSDTKDTHFSEYAPAWEMFNSLLKDLGLDIKVEGVDLGDIETIEEIIRLEKELGLDILPLVQNCFSAPFQVGNNRRKWERLTPVLAKNSPDHWCGSCHKCRRMTLGRIFYADPRLKHLSQEEIDSFVADTFDWMRKYPHNSDLLSVSFLEHLSALKD